MTIDGPASAPAIQEKRATMAPKKKHRCMVCSHLYDPALGDPDGSIPPGTAFEDLPESWACPDCGAAKPDFEPLED